MARAPEQSARENTTIPINAPDGHGLPVRVDVTFYRDGLLDIDVSVDPSASWNGLVVSEQKLTAYHFNIEIRERFT